ncbi:transcription-repair coupling factor, partial [candidate division KSB1 bacterium]
MDFFRNIETFVSNLESFKSLVKFSHEKGEITVSGVAGSLEPLLLYLLNRITGKPVFIIMQDEEQAEFFSEELNAFSENHSACYFPGSHEYGDTSLVLNPAKEGHQAEVLGNLCSGSCGFIVTSFSGSIRRVPEKNLFKGKTVVIKKGVTISPEELVRNLTDFGYTREVIADTPGDISLRGGILDIFPFYGSHPFRVEFFGDVVDSLRKYNPITQRSTGKADSLTILPSVQTWKHSLAGIDSYLPENTIVYVKDREHVQKNAEELFLKHKESFEDPSEFFGRLRNFFTINCSSLKGHNTKIDFGARSVSVPEISPGSINRLLEKKAENSKVYICCKDRREKEHLLDFLDLTEKDTSQIKTGIGPVVSGFEIQDEGFVLFTGQDIFGKKRRKRARPVFKAGIPIHEITSLKKGDYVVHIDYGIGRYKTLEKIEVDGIQQECLAIEYEGGDVLYVPLDSVDRVQKYSAGEGAHVKVNRLGTGAWERTKAKTKESVKRIARELIELYSKRRLEKGFSFSEDNMWQRSLESSFIYEETPEQARAIEDVKKDMESPRPMDRLICGDVGFGKTEVALRASFKAVNDSKQVAVLVPTTILAQQHFNTFTQRLSSFPVKVEVLSRFRTRKDQQKIVAGLKSGSIDIIIGTHRLLSKDIEFKDLGLLIIDEEQRFGVKQKEKLKALKKNVDVLSMSATPIPRTLQFSMTGIRDMSLITTPPRDRLPIHTEVVPFNEEIIKEAIENEIDRGGQIFFVHNIIKSIYAIEKMIKRLVPGARVVSAHGQMDSKHLEKVMFDFVNYKYDCLVSTMIIESGLDMPRVNTLLVHRADKLGLSQLYQIRGRVGRSGKRAYAFFLTPPFHSLSRGAVKRLRTIEEFTELGAGFQIARRDLEIRGAGNFFGVEQSGNVDSVGVELYTKIIEEAVSEIKQESSGDERAVKEITAKVTCHA